MRRPVAARSVVVFALASVLAGVTGPSVLGQSALGQETVVPDTVVPDTVVPDTVVPDTVVPDTVAEIPFASPRPAAVEVPSAPGAWGGRRTGTEPTLSNRVVKYEIQATLDPKAHTIDAEQKLTWRNRSDRPVPSVYLHLYLNAFEGPGSTFISEAREKDATFRSNMKLADGQWGHIELRRVEQSGVAVPWTFVHPDGGPETDHTVVRLDLPSPVPPGGSTTLDIGFHDQLPRVIARTGYYGTFHMVAQWFPKIGVLELPGERGATEPRWNVHEFHPLSEFYADWGEYDVRITVPKDYQVASTGQEQGSPTLHDGLVTRRFVQGDIHDFAWMAADNFAPPLQGSYDGPGSPHVTVKVFYPPEYAASAEPALRATIDSIRWFSETLGPYPYATSTVIVPPFNGGEAGGMEYQTLFTVLGFAEVVPDTLAAALLDFVTIHEFGHGYFYGLLASNEFEEPLLDEGLNEYWNMRMLRSRGQDIHMRPAWLRWFGVDPTGSGFALERGFGAALDDDPADPIAQNAWDRLSAESYGQVYNRTATVMHDLEQRIGSEAMERGFKAYYEQWHFRHPSLADFREALAQASGQRATVEQVFRQHVYGAGAVDLRVESLSSVEELPEPGTQLENGSRIELTAEAVEREVSQTRADWKKEHPDARAGTGPYPFRTTVVVRRDGAETPTTLRVQFADGSSETVAWKGDGLWRRFVFVKPAQATSAELDPERAILLDSDKLNDGMSLEPNRAASRRWSADASSLVEVFYTLLGSL
jgi:hypothetical protein